jgi:hypothetical protein
MDAAVKYMREMNSNLGNKIDQNNAEIREMNLNLGNKMDVISNKIDQSRTEITAEIRQNRDDFRSHLDERVANIEHELALIKAKVMPSNDF